MKYTNFMENLTCQNQHMKKYKTYNTYVLKKSNSFIIKEEISDPNGFNSKFYQIF